MVQPVSPLYLASPQVLGSTLSLRLVLSSSARPPLPLRSHFRSFVSSALPLRPSSSAFPIRTSLLPPRFRLASYLFGPSFSFLKSVPSPDGLSSTVRHLTSFVPSAPFRSLPFSPSAHLFAFRPLSWPGSLSRLLRSPLHPQMILLSSSLSTRSFVFRFLFVLAFAPTTSPLLRSPSLLCSRTHRCFLTSLSFVRHTLSFPSFKVPFASFSLPLSFPLCLGFPRPEMYTNKWYI